MEKTCSIEGRAPKNLRNKKLNSGAAQQIFAAHDVGSATVEVVRQRSEVVGRKSIAAADDRVTGKRVGKERLWPQERIRKMHHCVVRSAQAKRSVGRIERKVFIMARARILAVGGGGDDVFAGAVAGKNTSRSNKPLQRLIVARGPQCLRVVRRVIIRIARAFIPADAQPMQRFKNIGEVLGPCARRIAVVDA